MTRKDYELIADTIARAFVWVKHVEDASPGPITVERIKEAVTGEFERRLGETNPRFDKYRFVDACNKEQA